MQIVINMPKEEYNKIKENDCGLFNGRIYQMIRNSIPLPKGHGDLIDKNEIIKRYEGDCGRRIYVDNFIHDIELNTPTIIEADTEQEDKDANSN